MVSFAINHNAAQSVNRVVIAVAVDHVVGLSAGTLVVGAISTRLVIHVRTTWSRFVATPIASPVSATAAAVICSGVIWIGVVFIVSVAVTLIDTALSINDVKMSGEKLSCTLTVIDSRTPYSEIRERPVI